MATSLPTFQKRMDQTKTSAYTMTSADSGLVTNVQGAVTITLPVAAASLLGATFTIRNAGPNNGDTLVSIVPNAADAVNGLGMTPAVGKGVQQLATSPNQVGDEITIECNGTTGVNAWFVTNASGTWARIP